MSSAIRPRQFTDIGVALQQYQLEDPSFHPYSSKYDYAFLVELSNGKPSR